MTLTGAQHRDVDVLGEFAEFWKIPYGKGHSQEGKGILVSCGGISETEANTHASVLVFPSGLEDSKNIAKQYGLELNTKETLLRLPVSPDVSVSIRTRASEFSGPRVEPVISNGETPVLYRLRGTRVHLSSVNLVSEYERLITGGLEEVPSRKFRLVTKIPFSYRAIPP